MNRHERRAEASKARKEGKTSFEKRDDIRRYFGNSNRKHPTKIDLSPAIKGRFDHASKTK